MDHLFWSSAGYAHFIMDNRGQGSWGTNDTPDLEVESSGPQLPGFLTRGILAPQTYYYRRLFSDAVRAVEAVVAFPLVDATHILVTGGSQGGGITLAVNGLLGNLIELAMIDVPFLCHFSRATAISDAYPYQEIVKYCQVYRDKIETVFETLKYFDGMNFAARATSSSFFSVGLLSLPYPKEASESLVSYQVYLAIASDRSI